MTRAFRIAGIAALFMCAPLLASAQSPNPITAGVSLGISMPTGDWSEQFDNGYAVALHIYGGSANPDSRLKFRGNLSYDSWTGAVTLGKVTGRSVGGSVDGLFYLAKRDMAIRPYVAVGAGLYNTKAVVKINSVTNAQSGSTRPAVQGAGGLEFNLAGFSTMIEAKYVNVFGQDGSISWLPITFGVHF